MQKRAENRAAREQPEGCCVLVQYLGVTALGGYLRWDAAYGKEADGRVSRASSRAGAAVALALICGHGLGAKSRVVRF
jgi:hypothetical protein